MSGGALPIRDINDLLCLGPSFLEEKRVRFCYRHQPNEPTNLAGRLVRALTVERDAVGANIAWHSCTIA